MDKRIGLDLANHLETRGVLDLRLCLLSVL